MRKPLIAGNWKMNHTARAAMAFADGVSGAVSGLQNQVDMALFPSYTVLAALAARLKGTGIAVGAQEMHQADSGAFTGAVSASMILDAGATMVLIGHSERRQLFGETDAGVSAKVKKAMSAGLVPVMCIGETLAEREAGKTEYVLLTQLKGGLEGLGSPGTLIVAYEPVWAIGTGKTATPAQAQEAHALVRSWLRERFGAKEAESMRILYGGSVKPSNIAELLDCGDVDGGLVGGASLEAPSYVDLVRNSANSR